MNTFRPNARASFPSRPSLPNIPAVPQHLPLKSRPMPPVAPLALRPMNAEDIGPVVQMHQRAFEHGAWTADAMAREFSDHRLSVYYILEDRSGPAPALIGMFGCWRMPGEMHLVTICVEPDRQRRGLGRLLVCLALRLAQREGKTDMHLEARQSNAPARALYASLGFREVSVRRRLYADPPEDGILLTREIDRVPPPSPPLPLEIDWGQERERWNPAAPAVYSAAASAAQPATVPAGEAQ